jgi:hypothetical protein
VVRQENTGLQHHDLPSIALSTGERRDEKDQVPALENLTLVRELVHEEFHKVNAVTEVSQGPVQKLQHRGPNLGETRGGFLEE